MLRAFYVRLPFVVVVEAPANACGGAVRGGILQAMAEDALDPGSPKAAPVLPYAVPLPYEAEGVFREGNVLVVRKVSPPLPAMCVKCGDPVAHFHFRRFYWHHPALYLLLLGCVVMGWALLLYIVLALVFRQKAELHIPLCEEHETQRRRLRWAGIVTAMAALGAIALAIYLALSPPTSELYLVLLIVGFAALIAAVITAHFAAPLRARKITKTHAYLAGAGPAYLEGLPSR